MVQLIMMIGMIEVKIKKVTISSLSPCKFDAETRVAVVLAEVDVHFLSQ